MNFNLADPIIIAAIIAALSALTAALIKAIVTIRSKNNKQNVITLIQVQEGRNRTRIEQLKGTGSASKMETRIENRNNFRIHVSNPEGTTFRPRDKKLQEMVAVRPQVFEVSPESSEEFTIDALCLDAFKAMPPSTGEGGYKVEGITRNREVLKLLQAVRNLEEEISGKIISWAEWKGFTVRPMDADTEELFYNCQLFPNKKGGYDAKISDIIIQCALWQVTDKVNFDTLVKLTGSYSQESRIELERYVKLANTILRKAQIRPTISIL